jgi:isoleucyl-tRNA synthetase
LRRSRDAIKEEDKETKEVLYYVLKTISILMAPFTPFVAEHMYQQLRPLFAESKDSIHFYDMPKYEPETFSFGDNQLTQKIESLKAVINLGRMTRLDKCKVNSFKTPLLKVTVVHEDAAVTDYLKEFSDYISSELNVLEVDFHAGEKGYATLELDPDFMKIRELYPQTEVGKMVKVVKNFCAKKDLDLI